MFANTYPCCIHQYLHNCRCVNWIWSHGHKLRHNDNCPWCLYTALLIHRNPANIHQCPAIFLNVKFLSLMIHEFMLTIQFPNGPGSNPTPHSRRMQYPSSSRISPTLHLFFSHLKDPWHWQYQCNNSWIGMMRRGEQIHRFNQLHRWFLTNNLFWTCQ